MQYIADNYIFQSLLVNPNSAIFAIENNITFANIKYHRSSLIDRGIPITEISYEVTDVQFYLNLSSNAKIYIFQKYTSGLIYTNIKPEEAKKKPTIAIIGVFKHTFVSQIVGEDYRNTTTKYELKNYDLYLAYNDNKCLIIPDIAILAHNYYESFIPNREDVSQLDDLYPNSAKYTVGIDNGVDKMRNIRICTSRKNNKYYINIFGIDNIKDCQTPTEIVDKIRDHFEANL